MTPFLVAGKWVGAVVHTVAGQKAETDARIINGYNLQRSIHSDLFLPPGSYFIKATEPSKEKNKL